MIRTLLASTALAVMFAGGAFAGTLQPESAVNPRTVGASPEAPTEMNGVPNPTAPDATAPDLNRSTNRNRSMEWSPQVGAMPDDADRGPNLNRSTNKNVENDGITTGAENSSLGESLSEKARNAGSEDYYD